MKISRTFFASILLLLLGTSCLFAQEGSGQIYGVVSDSVTGAPLPGASVQIKGTSLGMATDIYGKYTLYSVPAGSYTLSVSYIGYRDKELPFNVTADAKVELNFALTAQALEGQEVIVTAQARGQKDAINEQLTSNTIINVVSAEKIHELPDASAATALSRLPGVSLMNGDEVVIRGVQAKLNQVLINGIELPSTDMNNRATNLGFISSNLLSGIEVVKALTPDMDANTVGGVVNLRLREAPSGLHFDVLSQGNYNSSDHISDNYKFWASVSNRFFDDQLGVFVQGNIDRTHGGNQLANIGFTFEQQQPDIWGQGVYQTANARFEFDDNITTNSGGSLILDYRLPEGKIVFQNTYAGNVTDQNNNVTGISNFNSGTSVYYGADRSLYGKELWINALQAENTFGSVKVDATLSHSYSQQYTRFGHDLGPTNANTVFSGATNAFPAVPLGQLDGFSLSDAVGVFNSIDPASAATATGGGGQWLSINYNAFAEHLYNSSVNASVPVTFSNEISATFKTGGKYVRTTRTNNIDERRATDANDIYANPVADTYFPGITLSPTNPLPLSAVVNNNFKKGKYFLGSFYNLTNGGYRWAIDESKYDEWLKLSSQDWAAPFEAADSWQNDWNGAEQFSAGYLMGTIKAGTKLTILGGARFESYNMNYHANLTFVEHNVLGNAISTANGSIADSVNPVQTEAWYDANGVFHPTKNVDPSTHNVDRTDNNVFPGLQLQYKLTDYSDIRFAYTTGISRPDYQAIIPKFEFETGAINMGNPGLKPATSRNFDILGTVHDNTIGLFSVGLFYKEIKNQIYNTQLIYKEVNEYSDVWLPDSAYFWNRFGYLLDPNQNVNLSLNNQNLGYIRGVEIDWQTNFWYLPQPLNALVLDVNYTKSGSNTNYIIIQKIVTNTVVIDPVTGRQKVVPVTTLEDTAFSGRLIQQANDVVNAALGIDYKGFSGRLSFNMTGNVLSGVGSRPELMQYTGNIYRWDFSLKQNLPIDGLSLALNGNNIFHNGISFYQNFKLNPNAPVTKNLTQVLYSPTSFEMNLRYSF
ncbi:MAG TPA: TonB-dependent receptor [Nitrospirota bacterium]|nr:TonB-dependent receptor [Nitrospirota bacterium]